MSQEKVRTVTSSSTRRPKRSKRGEPPLDAVSELKSLGPKSQQVLARVGITRLEQLREVGSIAAFVRAKRANAAVTLNLLWGLESALTGEPWQVIARQHRTSLLLALDEYERAVPPD